MNEIVITVIMSLTIGYWCKLPGSLPAATIVCTEWQNNPLNCSAELCEEVHFCDEKEDICPEGVKLNMVRSTASAEKLQKSKQYVQVSAKWVFWKV